MATAVVEERQLLKSLRWWDGFTIALCNPGFLLGSLLGGCRWDRLDLVGAATPAARDPLDDFFEGFFLFHRWLTRQGEVEELAGMPAGLDVESGEVSAGCAAITRSCHHGCGV